MQTILDMLQKAEGWHPGLYLKVDHEPYMELVIEAMDEPGPCGLPALTGFALRLVLSDHTAIPREGEPDPLTEAAAVFLTDKPKPKKSAAKAKQPTPIQPAKAAAKKTKNKTPIAA